MRCLLILAVVFFGGSLQLCAENTSSAEPARGVWPSLKRTWHATVDGAASAGKATGSAVQSVAHSVVDVFLPGAPKAAPKSPLKLTLACAPSPLVLEHARSLTVLVKVFNSGKKTQLLEFSSSQRADAVLRDQAGKIVSRVFMDSVLRNESALLTVNPGERLEYSLSLPTDGLVAGKVYRVEGALVGQAGLTAALEITPR